MREHGVVATPQRPRRVIAGSPFAQPVADAGPAPVFEVGDRVTHDRHGMGKVVMVGYPGILRIDFGTNGVRQLPATDAGLSAL
jgi:hypothetical protein